MQKLKLRNVKNIKIMAMTVFSLLWDVKGFKFLCRVFMICILLIQIPYELIILVIWIFQTFGLEFWASWMKTFSNIRQLCCLVIIEIKVIKIWIEVNELQHLEFFRYLRTRASCSHKKSHSSAAFSCTICETYPTLTWLPCMQFYKNMRM